MVLMLTTIMMMIMMMMARAEAAATAVASRGGTEGVVMVVVMVRADRETKRGRRTELGGLRRGGDRAHQKGEEKEEEVECRAKALCK